MAKTAELRTVAHKSSNTVEIVLIQDGHPIGSVCYTQEQAEQHARQVVEAIEIVNANKSKLILPERIGRPFH